MKLYSSLPSAMMETTRGGARGKRQTCCVDSRARESGSSAVSLFILIRIPQTYIDVGVGPFFFFFSSFPFFVFFSRHPRTKKSLKNLKKGPSLFLGAYKTCVSKTPSVIIRRVYFYALRRRRRRRRRKKTLRERRERFISTQRERERERERERFRLCLLWPFR